MAAFFRIDHSFLALALMAAFVPAWAEETVAGKPMKPAARTVDVEFLDRGQMRLALEADRLDFETPYGRLSIPVAEVLEVDLAVRLTEGERKRIDAAIFNLGSSDFALREEAGKELLALEEKAYPSLLKACQHADLEVAQRAKELVAKLQQLLPEERLVVREFDVVETSHSRIAGRIVEDALPVQTRQFGRQQLQLTDVRRLRSTDAPDAEPEVANVQPDPGNLLGFHSRIGQTLAFKVTGRADGSVYGTGVYTTDSNLATAAVHTGLLKPGETGVVRVTMIPSPPGFTSSTQNGITSSAWGPYPAAYQIVFPKKRADRR